MRGPIAKYEDARKKGGDLVAVLFFMASAAAMAAIIGLSHAILAPADTLMAQIPSAAIAYVHADGPEAVRRLADLAPLPLPPVNPRELALYVMQDEDGAVRWRALMGWRWPFEPSAQDRVALDTARAIFLDDRLVLLGEPELSASFGLEPRVTAGLDAARERARVQAFADLSALPRIVPNAPAIDARLVSAIVLRDDRLTARTTLIGPPTTAVSGIDALVALFGRGSPDDRAAQVAAATASRFLEAASPSVAVISPGTPEARIEVFLQGVTPDQTQAELMEYATLRWPDRAVLTLPDGELHTELRSIFGPEPILRFGEARSDIYALHDTVDGTVIAERGLPVWFPPTECTGTPPSFSLRAETPQGEDRGLFPWLPYSTLTLTEQGPQEFTLCAYK